MIDRRPVGFHKYVRRHGFHSIYLITTMIGNPVKVGIADDVVSRFNSIQSSNFAELKIHRYWWMAGRAISERVESAFKREFSARQVRGEWFDLDLTTAEAFIPTKAKEFNTWAVSEADVIDAMERYHEHQMDWFYQ